MSAPTLRELLSRWGEALEQGRDLTPQELCPERPELYAELGRAIAALRGVQALLGGTAAGAEEAPTRALAGALSPTELATRILPGAQPAPGAGPSTRVAGPSVPSPGEQGGPPSKAELADGTPSRLGRFEVIRLLGEGAFGRVYEAHDPQLDRRVALKVAKPEMFATEQRARRFLREARAAAGLRHPGIVPVYDSGREGNALYIASAFIQGRSLEKVAAEHPDGMPLEEAARLVRRMAEALAYAHSHARGLVHRDIKPSNVMVDELGEPLVMDFGLAAREEAGEEKLSADGTAMGTPAYMAPEQGRGQAVPQSDQYSLGCLLFELLTGRLPFEGGSAAHLLFLHASQPAPSPRQFRREVPRDLETICLKCLEKGPEKRYADCQELADDLRRWLEGEPIVARPTGAMEWMARWAKRSPVTASLVGAVAVLLVVGSLVAWVLAAWAINEKRRADGESVLAQQAAEKARGAADLAKEREKQAKESAVEAKVREKQAKENEALANKEKVAAIYQASRAEEARHSIQMAVVLRALEQHDVVRAETVLADVLPLFRDCWETRHLRRLCRRKALPLLGHELLVTSVAFSPDGGRLASGSFDGTTRIWDAQTGRELLVISEPARPFVALEAPVFRLVRPHVTSVSFSPDGKRVASAAENGVRVRDAQTGRELATLRGHGAAVTSVAFSPSGKRIATTSEDGTVRVWGDGTVREMADEERRLRLSQAQAVPRVVRERSHRV